MTYAQVVVVIPAHDESTTLPTCLEAVMTAATCLPMPVLIVVVLDAWEDRSGRLTGRFGSDVRFVKINARNVGAARAAGFAYARSSGDMDAVDESLIWYATTDADSRVDPDWLVRQTRTGADMVLGLVRVANWRNITTAAIRSYLAAYRAKTRPDWHGHVHGANMGFRADAYWRVGGFASLTTGEDVDLVRRFEADGRLIDRDVELSVVTSARQTGRAPRGFASHLRSVRPVKGRETA